ncbi:hypothetical protein VTN00DRAFT_5324 [Thermoascus crustaceus]|uniref:uncharacterized protein n=1 Tax=Thermoascus crustaceus TaxID=5088 RepID=UPI00374229DD
MSGEYGYSRSDVPSAEYGGGGGSSASNYYHYPRVDFDNDDFSGAISQARHHADDDDDVKKSSFFSEAISFLKQNKGRFTGSDNDNDLDDQKFIGAHQSLYGGGESESGSSHDANSLGMGAALQALKLLTASPEGEDQSQGGGSAKDKLIGLAMAQAGKLWEEKHGGGSVDGDKQSAINAAAEMALKLYLKSQGSGLNGTGGPSGLMSLASKFLQ